MLKAAWHTFHGALGDFSGASGVLLGAAGVFLGLSGTYSVYSIWFWIGASILLFVRCIILFRQMENGSYRPSPAPDMSLADTVTRICGKPGLKECDEKEIRAALASIRGKARNMNLEVFGKELGDTSEAYLEHAPREFIYFDYWSDHMIDADSFKSDQRGKTKPTGHSNKAIFIDLWFDRFKINVYWPPSKSWKERIWG